MNRRVHYAFYCDSGERMYELYDKHDSCETVHEDAIIPRTTRQRCRLRRAIRRAYSKSVKFSS